MSDNTINFFENSKPDTKYNYNRMDVLLEIAKGNNVILIDDGEEYRSICDTLGAKHTKIKEERRVEL